MQSDAMGRLILRFAMATVFLYFGFSQLFDGANWIGYVPAWASHFLHVAPAAIVLGNGIFEVALGALLALGLFVTPAAILLAAHLFVIAAGFGLSPLGIRDLGLTLATLSLAFFEQGKKIKEGDK